ncbi:hypothetical protein JNB91_26485 [Rhizobium wenxiniae]|nr:hypothetical protein [Rhizobium wenxiniae]
MRAMKPLCSGINVSTNAGSNARTSPDLPDQQKQLTGRSRPSSDLKETNHTGFPYVRSRSRFARIRLNGTIYRKIVLAELETSLFAWKRNIAEIMAMLEIPDEQVDTLWVWASTI